jgi:hypothetical protein
MVDVPAKVKGACQVMIDLKAGIPALRSFLVAVTSAAGC